MDRLIITDAAKVSPAEHVRLTAHVFAGRPPSPEYLAAVEQIRAAFKLQPMTRQEEVEKLTGWARAEAAAVRPRRAA